MEEWREGREVGIYINKVIFKFFKSQLKWYRYFFAFVP